MDTSHFSASGQHLRQIVEEYDYIDEDGARLYQTVRYEPKDFRQRRSDGNGGWIWKGPERPVPYKLPELIASGTAPVLIAGGEKDVDNLRALGIHRHLQSRRRREMVAGANAILQGSARLHSLRQ